MPGPTSFRLDQPSILYDRIMDLESNLKKAAIARQGLPYDQYHVSELHSKVAALAKQLSAFEGRVKGTNFNDETFNNIISANMCLFKKAAIIANGVLNKSCFQSRTKEAVIKISDASLSLLKETIEKEDLDPNLITVPSPLSVSDSRGSKITLLGLACLRGDIEMVAWLCARPGFNVNFGFHHLPNVVPALFVAASAPISSEVKRQILDLLLQHNADPLLSIDVGQLWILEYLNRIPLDCLQLLLEKYADDPSEAYMETSDSVVISALDVLVFSSRRCFPDPSVIRMFVYHGIEFHPKAGRLWSGSTGSTIEQLRSARESIDEALKLRNEVELEMIRSYPDLIEFPITSKNEHDLRLRVARACVERDRAIQESIRKERA